MSEIISRTDPTPVLVRAIVHGTGATGTLLPPVIGVRIAFNATSTATANMAWINPENGTVLAKAYWCWTTAGTGTFDAGRKTDGTGSASDMIIGGTLALGVVHQVTSGSALTGTVGEINKGWWLLGPGGTGTNNSIVTQVTDTITSTAIGFMVVQYQRIT